MKQVASTTNRCMFLRNVVWFSLDYTARYPTIQKSSLPKAVKTSNPTLCTNSKRSAPLSVSDFRWAQVLWLEVYCAIAQRTARSSQNTALLELRVFLFPPSTSFLASYPWVPGIKRPQREAGHSSSPSSADVKNSWNYTPTPPIHFRALEVQG